MLVTAVAPIAWGATYYVTRQFLPPDAPVWGAALRALPAGLLLLLVARRLPRGSWWWRSFVLGTLNFGAFFVLVYASAQLLPTSIAASIMALAPLALGGLGWLLLSRRPTPRIIVGAAAGILGVLLIVGLGSSAPNLWGVVASLAALMLSSLGAILTTKWRDETPLLTTTAWQLTAGGLLLVVAAVVTEGAPPAVDTAGLLAFAFVAVVATALAFVCWFAGLRRLAPASVGVIGLLNPVTGVVLGATLAAEALTAAQYGGIALVLVGILFAQSSGARTRATPRVVTES